LAAEEYEEPIEDEEEDGSEGDDYEESDEESDDFSSDGQSTDKKQSDKTKPSRTSKVKEAVKEKEKRAFKKAAADFAKKYLTKVIAALTSEAWAPILAILVGILVVVGIFAFLMFSVCLGKNCGRTPEESVNVIKDGSTISELLGLAGDPQKKQEFIVDKADKLIKELEQIKNYNVDDPEFKPKVEKIIGLLNEIIIMKGEGAPTKEKSAEALTLIEEIKEKLSSMYAGKFMDYVYVKIDMLERRKPGATQEILSKQHYFRLWRAKDPKLKAQIIEQARIIAASGATKETIDPGNGRSGLAQCKAPLYLILNRVWRGTDEYQNMGSQPQPNLQGERNIYFNGGKEPDQKYFELLYNTSKDLKIESGDLIHLNGWSPNSGPGGMHWVFML